MISVSGDVGGEGEKSGQRAVIQAEKDDAFAAAKGGDARHEHGGGEDDPRADEINGVGRERQRLAGIEDDLAVLIEHEAAQENEVGADEAEVGERGPTVAEEKNDDGAGEKEIGGHGKAADGIDGGAEIGEGDGEESEGLGFFLVGEGEDVNGPKKQEETGDERALDDADGIEIVRGVERDVEAGETEGEQGAAEDGQAVLEALGPHGDAEAGEAAVGRECRRGRGRGRGSGG